MFAKNRCSLLTLCPIFLEKYTYGGQENGALGVAPLDREETQNLMPLGAVPGGCQLGWERPGSQRRSVRRIQSPLASSHLPTPALRPVSGASMNRKLETPHGRPREGEAGSWVKE